VFKFECIAIEACKGPLIIISINSHEIMHLAEIFRCLHLRWRECFTGGE
jgi:hypothetical protein